MAKKVTADIIENIRIEYISDPKMSYRKLAEKHGVSLKTISRIGKQENWKQLRVQLGDKILKKTMNRISTEKSDELAKVISTSSKLLNHINKALDREDEFNAVFVTKDGSAVTLEKADARAIKDMASALNSLMTIFKTAEGDDKNEADGFTIGIEGVADEDKE